MRKRKIEKTLYLSEEENKILEEKCKKLNLSKSDYIRKLIKEYTPVKADMSILEKHHDEFKMIGNGLNDIARDAHRYGYIKERDLNHYLTWLNDICDDIKFNLNIE